MSLVSYSDYKCSLIGEVLEKAKKELKEDPNTRIIEVKNLRTRLEKVPGLQPRTDIKFLLPFLRARKFDQERAFQLVKNYYEVRKEQPDMFDDLKPSRVKHVIEAGIYEVLKGRDNQGCRVIVMRPGKWDPDRFPITDLPKASFLILSKIIMEDEETQVNGIHMINNLAGATMKQASHIGPSIAKKFLHLIQDVIPLRLKRFDYVNEPTFFDIVFAIFKQFQKEKFTKRIVLNGDKFDKLHESINPELLPTDLGGKQEPYANKEWVQEFLASDGLFSEDNKFGFLNMNLQKNKDDKKADSTLQGLGGTFKKLEI
uniref:CRAL-TRIO domain-containing protein n=1 Tax=Biomphalaria glabrata TaxID=6526 RepID=A0A2C9JGD4_BIOGL